MAAPKGQYTPATGALRGQTFASYYRYQQARAQALGFPSYSAQRQVMGISLVQNLVNRAVSVGGMSRFQAQQTVSQWWRDQSYHGRSARPGAAHSDAQGARKRAAIAFAMENGLYDDSADAADEIPY